MSGPAGSSQWMYASGGDYEIPYSCRFDGTTAQLSQTFSSAGTSRRKWTLSVWAKAGSYINRALLHTRYTAYPSPSTHLNLFLESGGQLRVEEYDSGGNYNFRRSFDGYYRDASAWYHFTIAFDSTDSTENDRIKVYRNGVRMGIQHTYVSVPLNFDTGVNDANTEMWVGSAKNGTYWDGCLAEYHFIDGQALTPSSFGETGDYGEWKPIEVDGLTYGTNGFYLDFSDSAALGDDAANSNDFTVSNLTASDQVLDTPTNNFCTWNPLSDYAGSTFSEGNTKVSMVDNATDHVNAGNFGMTTGKWYFEVYYAAGTPEAAIGVIKNWEDHQNHNFWVGGTTDAYVYYRDGYKRNNSNVSYGASFAVGDIISIELDMDNGTIDFHKNGVSQGEAFTGLSGTFFPVVGEGGSASNETFIINAGQDSSFAGNKTAQGNTDGGGKGDFYYTPPSGFKALCTANLPAVAVTPSEHFNTVLWSGNSSTQSITGVGFQPDLTWIKQRNSTQYHQLTDSVRGTNSQLFSNTHSAEDTATDKITSFDSDGFSLDSHEGVNDSGDIYVGWNWLAGNTTLGTGAFTQGTIASTCSRNVDAGFSIVHWTGTGSAGTVGHGLSVAPEMIIAKGRDNGDNWRVGSDYISGWNYNIALDITDDEWINTGVWNSTAPTTSLFSIGTDGSMNIDTNKYIAYCFYSVDGYSKVGSYTGNNSADGTFVYLGFRPAFILVKRRDSNGTNWYMFDNKREGYNADNDGIYANNTTAEESTDRVDLLSNGFKWRHAGGDLNPSGGTMIYYAVAEQPFKYANAR